MKELGYRWSRSDVRPEWAFRAELEEQWWVFRAFVKWAVEREASLIFIDESSFSDRTLSYWSWLHLGSNERLVKLTAPKSVTVISAIDSDGWLLTVFREGTNTEVEFNEFINLVLNYYRDLFGVIKLKDWKKKLVFVFDNARIHLTERVKQTFIRESITALTLPAYSPELNPIELVFGLAKRQLVKTADCNK